MRNCEVLRITCSVNECGLYVSSKTLYTAAMFNVAQLVSFFLEVKSGILRNLTDIFILEEQGKGLVY
jgi:hypothetical protein